VRRRALLSGSVATLATLPEMARAQWVDCGGLVPAMVTNPGPCDPSSLDLTFMVPGSLDPRITFTRASTATYFNSAGVMQTAATNAPRWDHDATTRALRGLLIEEARTNLLLNSATLGTQSVTVSAVAYTLSFYGTGTITKSGTATGALVGTGVGQRVLQTFTPTAGSLTLTVTGTVSNAQLEAGAFATSYIPVVGAPVTRAADVATMPTTGWYNATLGTFAADFILNAMTAASYPRILGDNASGKAFLYIDPTLHLGAFDSGSIAATANVVTLGALSKGASVTPTAPGNASYALNGGTVASHAMGFGMGSPSAIRLFGDNAPGDTANGWMRSVRYWNRALSNTELQAITT
jgi:hypothetical protein